MKKFFILIIFIFSISSFSSCLTWSQKNWDSLTDRTFYFKSLKYVKKSAKKEFAFQQMKNFPFDYVFKFLSHKYDIKISVSDFEKFIISGDVSRIEAKGFLSYNEFIWKENRELINYIEVEFGEISTNNNLQLVEYEYKISIVVNGKPRETIFNKVPYYASVAELIPADLGYKKVTDGIFLNKKSGKEINLATVSYKPDNSSINTEIKQEVSAGNSVDNIKKDIQEYLSGKSPDEKKKFRDELVKYLYTIIE
jgi:hypothetical protein